MLLDALFHCREGSDGLPLKNFMVGKSTSLINSLIFTHNIRGGLQRLPVKNYRGILKYD
jgi:hypothetical protein